MVNSPLPLWASVGLSERSHGSGCHSTTPTASPPLAASVAPPDGSRCRGLPLTLGPPPHLLRWPCGGGERMGRYFGTRGSYQTVTPSYYEVFPTRPYQPTRIMGNLPTTGNLSSCGPSGCPEAANIEQNNHFAQCRVK